MNKVSITLLILLLLALVSIGGTAYYYEGRLNKQKETIQEQKSRLENIGRQILEKEDNTASLNNMITDLNAQISSQELKIAQLEEELEQAKQEAEKAAAETETKE